MTTLCAILALLASICINVVIDTNGVTDHFKQWLRYKLPISLPAVTLFTIASDAYWLTAIATSVALCTTWFLILFNGLINLERHKPWFYPGSPGPEDGWWEQIQRSMPLWCWILINVLVVGFGTIVYVLNYQV